MKCCVCYESINLVQTECNHYTCLSCLLKLKQIKCPYCRHILDTLPEIIKDTIKKNNDNDDDEPISFGGGGLGVFWDAPGSNYFNLSDKQKELMEKINAINFDCWSNLRYEINHCNKNHTEEYLLKCLDSIKDRSSPDLR